MYHRGASKLANTKSASLLIASDSAIATKNEKTEISRDFSRFFDPEFFSEFHRSLLPFSMLCPDSDSRKRAKFDCYQFVESLSRSAVFLSKLIGNID